MSAGRITEIWRYPVKSMGGERIRETSLGANGLPGDRAWAVRDEVRGGIRGAKKIPALMRCSARYTSAPSAERAPAPEIGLPGGETLRADAPTRTRASRPRVGTPVTLWPLRPASDVEHYRRGAPDSTDVLTELRSIFGREEGEPLPDLSVFPPDLFQYESPPGTYFDAFPLLLMTGTSLRRLAQLAPFVTRRRAPLPPEPRDRDAGTATASRSWLGRASACASAARCSTSASPARAA